jgi:hypothetical protein
LRLCDEYLLRNSLEPRCARHVHKGFLYFEEGRRLLCIEWANHGPHPGFYEFSECELGRRCRTLSLKRVQWEEYESHLVSWVGSASGLVFDKTKVFDLTWQYFLRRHEDSLVGLVPLSEIYGTADENNPSRLVDCMALLERVSVVLPEAVKFWHSRAFDIVSLYCHWLGGL